MTVAESLRQRLQDRLDPNRLEIVDESARHRGHAGWREGGETHFRVVVEAGCFAGRSRVERQRMVHGAVADLLREQIHALSITALAPGEAERAG